MWKTLDRAHAHMSVTRVTVLTTDTSHHTFFVRELRKEPIELHVIAERQPVVPPFETFHPFETLRDEYELELFFQGEKTHLPSLAPTVFFDSVNDIGCREALTQLQPEIVIVYGTGRIKPETLAVCPRDTLNLHGGDPERYRGLDSHLWAIYHGEYHELIVTLHRVNSKLDDGEIVAKKLINLRPRMKLHELRAANTQLCLELAREAIESYRAAGVLRSEPQTSRGRYYSFMPSVLKEVVKEKFERFTETLGGPG